MYYVVDLIRVVPNLNRLGIRRRYTRKRCTQSSDTLRIPDSDRDAVHCDTSALCPASTRSLTKVPIETNTAKSTFSFSMRRKVYLVIWLTRSNKEAVYGIPNEEYLRRELAGIIA